MAEPVKELLPVMKNMRTETVKFNVGGVKYEVSKSQIDLYPNTMLARSVSDQWRPDNVETEIFIDRNGNLFQYVLDYMRQNGKVHIPMTVSKDALIDELAYYGFEGVDVKKVQREITESDFINVYNACKELQAKVKSTANCSYIVAKLIDEYIQFWVRRKPSMEFSTEFFFKLTDEETRKRFRETRSALGEKHILKYCNKVLNQVGLYLKSCSLCNNYESVLFVTLTLTPEANDI